MLGPTFAPLLGSLGKAAADLVHHAQHVPRHAAAAGRRRAHACRSWPTTGCCRASCRWRIKRTDCPWAATLLTAGMRHHLPACRRSHLDDRRGELHLPHRHLHAEHRGVAAAPRHARCGAPLPRAARHHRARALSPPCVWLLSAMLGFQQFGLPTVLFGLALAYSGAALYAWRVIEDRRRAGPAAARADAARQAHRRHAARAGPRRHRLPAGGQHGRRPSMHALVAVLEDIFVVVALLTITRRPGAAGHDHLLGDGGQRGRQAADAGHAARLLAGDGARSAAATSTRRMPRSTSCRSKPNSRDELGEMADSFNMLQEEVRDAALGLDDARENMRTARAELMARHDADRPPCPSRPADRPAQPHAARPPGSPRFSIAPIDDRRELRACSPSTSITSRKPTTCSAMRSATSCLCAVARRLEVAADGDFIARIGGDEFTLVCAQPRPAQGRRACSRSRSAAGCCGAVRGAGPEDPHRPEHRRRGLSDTTEPTPSTLLANADAALYRAKADGRQDGPLLQPRSRSPPARTLRAAASICARPSPQRAAAPLPAASEDRRRGVRLRSARAMAASRCADSCRRTSSSRSPSRTA